MMIAAVVRGGERALGIDRAAEFAAPDDQRIVEQAAVLEIFDQRGRGLIGVAALPFQCARQVAVLVPAHVEELNEPHAAFGQPAGQQAVGGIGAGLLHLGAVHVEHVLRLVLDVGQLGHGGLHAKRHLVLRDARGDFRVAGIGELLLVQLARGRRASTGETSRSTPAGFERYSTGSPACGTSRLDTSTAGSRCPTAGRTAADRRAGRCLRSARRTPADPGSRSPARKPATSRCSAGRQAGCRFGRT